MSAGFKPFLTGAALAKAGLFVTMSEVQDHDNV